MFAIEEQKYWEFGYKNKGDHTQEAMEKSLDICNYVVYCPILLGLLQFDFLYIVLLQEET